MSRNEAHQMPLHFAVRMNRPEMVALLLELGADPLSVDVDGFHASAYATRPDVDRRIMEAVGALVFAELDSADRGHRRPNAGLMDLAAMLSIRNWEAAARLLRENPGLVKPGGAAVGALHLMAKRNDMAAVRWLLEHGADVNARSAHWSAEVAPLHLAAMQGHLEMARLLLDAGADPHIRDSEHDSSPLGWAQFFRREEVARLLKDRADNA